MKIEAAFKSVFKRKGTDLEQEIKGIKMDSRLVEEGDVFFAIGGGNKFVEATLEKGASLVIYDDPKVRIDNRRALLVDDTVEAMQELAREYRKLLDVKIIGITGTNGKTSTKDIVYSVLSRKYRGIKSQGNYNNHIGLPYTILQLREGDEFAVLEMGMSNFGEIDLLCEISGIDYGIITNIGESHLEFLKTVDNVFKAKGEMLKYLAEDRIILFGDDEYLRGVDGVKVGFEEENSFILSRVAEDEEGVEFTLSGEKYRIPINGYYNAINAALGVVLGKAFGMSYEEIRSGLIEASLSSMRYEKTKISEKLYINDAYNADPLSMRSAFKSFDKLYNDTYKVMVLGDMLELGEGSGNYHKNLKGDLEGIKADLILLYGEEMRALKEAFGDTERVLYFENKEDIVKRIDGIEGRTTILLKGSRGMKLEEIIR